VLGTHGSASGSGRDDNRWQELARRLGTGRSATAVQQHWYQLGNSAPARPAQGTKRRRAAGGEEEDEVPLAHAVRPHNIFMPNVLGVFFIVNDIVVVVSR